MVFGWLPCCEKDKESEASSSASESGSEAEAAVPPTGKGRVHTSTKKSVTISNGPPSMVSVGAIPHNSIISAEERRLYDENESGDSVFFPPGLLDQLAENELEAPGLAKSMRRSVTAAGSLSFGGSPQSLVLSQGPGLQRQVTAMATSAMSKSFAFQAGQLPDAQAPSNQEPVGSAVVEGISMEDVLGSLKSNSWPLAKFLKDAVDAFDIADSKWNRDEAIADTKLRRLQYTMPVPADVPAAIKRLIALPDTSKVTTVYRLRGDEETITLVGQTYTHDVAYGENFCVQETLSFRADPSGDTNVTKWVETVWVKPLPWTHGALRSFIDKKSIDSARESFPTFLRILSDECS